MSDLFQANGDLHKLIADAINRNRTRYLVFGAILVAAGIAAIIFPVISTFATIFMIGWLLVLAGIVQGAHAMSYHETGAKIIGVLIALVTLIAGLMTIYNPLVGTLSITMLLTVYFLMDGVFRILAALRFRPHGGWSIMLLNGVVSLAMAFILFFALPGGALWVLGVLVGVNFVFMGLTLFTLVAAARNASL
ncbi:MAG: DUF308 domain-containing protein [Parvibaculaceae bacterium]|nr:DUF308 domain-containing protein [Parvibaculaceae bacterium]